MTSTIHDEHVDHDHAHSDGCGHVAIPPGDHVDYLPDGHIHRQHEDHYDECGPSGHTVHESHDHVHGQGCGHVAIPHEDHVDYVHDGCRHAAHGDHYDEH